MNWLSIGLKIVIGVTGYGVWAFMAWLDPSLRSDFLKFNIIMATGTIGLVLRDMASAGPGVVTETKTLGNMSVSTSQPVAASTGFSQFGNRQQGRSLVYVLFVLAVLVLAVLLMTGCASLTQAGNTAYSFEPVIGADGKATGGCKFTATDGKEYASRNIAATSSPEGCQVIVQEGASTAFQGQAIAGKALSVLPSFAPILLPPGPAAAASKP